MNQGLLLAALVAALAAFGYFFGRARAIALTGGKTRSVHSRPAQHGALVALWVVLPAVAVLAGWWALGPVVGLPADGAAQWARVVAVLAVAIGGLWLAMRRVRAGLRARNHVETVIRSLLFLASALCICCTRLQLVMLFFCVVSSSCYKGSLNGYGCCFCSSLQLCICCTVYSL